ncbi:MAG: DNA topoisomerase IV [Crocinitomicaceae bacterium]|nr:DNA topoisomerase IV [Crocinitomicaceae bacterium]|tara:strand:- start:1180 stop:3903 length:2724 start_codon:yes stop_codon:yes gene_type:complete
MSSEENVQNFEEQPEDDKIISLSGLYKDWFLDYASYVILERAVPAIEDGLKPVQRRILHSMKELDDGRYNKVANIIGNTMKYHPHGDTSIGDAIVQIGQKDLLIDCQGNWGNVLTGDRAAAARYIEARVTKFANHVLYNPKTTNWLSSYDGRNKEPQYLPVKFPVLLNHGAEGIAVGLACKILPHNFIELIEASINYLRGKKVELLPDFENGGLADFTQYNDGLRGGKVRVRASIEKINNKTLIINQIPYGTTTDSLIESIVKATDKNKIKVKKIEDNTASNAEIVIHIPTGVSPDKMIDALYAFTNCEMSISPNACVIDGNKPIFIGVTEILKRNTDHTVELLKKELEIKKEELENQWHWLSLERIFIENRIYRDIEEEETWEGVIKAIDKGLKPHIKNLKKKVSEEDIVKLTEIKIKRISKFDSNKADDNIFKIEEQIKEVVAHLSNLINYAIDYFKNIKSKYSEGKERKTEIRVFDNINASKVIVSNKKLYVNKEEGFIGWSLRKDQYVEDCSDLDDVILFFQSGNMIVTKMADKKFVGKGIIHAAIWKKGDKRTIYHMIYQAGKSAPSYMKRFSVSSITRDRDYNVTGNMKDAKIHYFSVNPNGRRETVQIKLRPRPKLKKLKIDLDFGELLIKSRTSKGNLVTKNFISKVEQREVGGSTLAARKIWWDEVVCRLNNDERGKHLGSFKGDDKILTIYKSGHYLISGFELSNRFSDDLIHIEKFHSDRPISCVYWNSDKELFYVKRFNIENLTKKHLFIPEENGTELVVASTQYLPKVCVTFNKRLKETKDLQDKVFALNDIIDIKGVKAKGNQLSKLKIKSISLLPTKEGEDWPESSDITSDNINNEDSIETEHNKEDNIVKEEVKNESKENVIDEKSIEVEWSIEDKSNENDIDEEGQMKIF